MDKYSLKASLEALLFMYGEPMAISKVAKVLSVSEEEINKLLKAFNSDLNGNSDRGLMLVQKDDYLQLATKPKFGNILKKVFEKEFKEDLTPSALEIIAILAYSGPLDRAEIEYIRGVNSSHALRNLTLRGLVGRDEKKYSVSFDLLKHLGLSSLKQLPEYEKNKELLDRFRQGKNE